MHTTCFQGQLFINCLKDYLISSHTTNLFLQNLPHNTTSFIYIISSKERERGKSSSGQEIIIRSGVTQFTTMGSNNSEFSKKNITNLAIISLIFTGMVFLSISTTITKFFSPFNFSFNQCPCSSSPDNNKGMMAVSREKEEDELERALKRASMEENKKKTLIITIVNKAYVEGEKSMLDLFLESFWVGDGTQGLVDNLLLVAMDQIAYDRCKFLRLHCYRLVTDGVDYGGEKLYMSRDFINMMWSRTRLLAEVLRRGYSFIFTDTDIMWLRNPFGRLSQNETVDIQMSCDKFNGNEWSEANLINTGFYFVRSNNKTISLFETWYTMRNDTEYITMKEQDVLKSLISKGILSNLGLRVRYLKTVYFSGFCQDSKRFGTVTTVHANCCRTISAKISDLTTVLRDWRKLKILIADWKRLRASNRTAANGFSMHRWSEHRACIDSWKGFNNGNLV